MRARMVDRLVAGGTAAVLLLTFVVVRTGSAEASGQPEFDAAVALYGPASMELYPASAAAFDAAFPLLDLYYVVEGSGLPGDNHAMAWDGFNGYDVTEDFNTLLSGNGVILASAGEALKYAKAYAQTANAELQLIRRVVGASDSQALGQTVQDPAATLLIDGWRVTLWTWAAENGVLEAWTIRFTDHRVSQADWVIEGVALGSGSPRLEGVDFREGMRLSNSYNQAVHTLVASQQTQTGWTPLHLPWEGDSLAWIEIPAATETNFDLSEWVVYHPSDDPPDASGQVLEAALAYADGGKYAYGKQVTSNSTGVGCSGTNQYSDNWGFTVKDADCTYEIWISYNNLISCVACTTESLDSVGIRLSPFIKEYFNARGYYTNEDKHTVESLARSIMGHELFHCLHRFHGWGDSSFPFIQEGMARFAQTVLTPTVEDDPSSLWYGTASASNEPWGVNYLQLHAGDSMCPTALRPPQRDRGPGVPGDEAAHSNHSYDYALYWGYLYKENGGFSTLRQILSQLALAGPITLDNCGTSVPAAIKAALLASGGAHVSHEQVLAGLGVQMHAKDFQWGPPGGATNQWGAHLVDVKPEPHTYGPVAQPHLLGSWALQIVPLPQPNIKAYAISYLPSQPGDETNWRLRIVTKRGGEYHPGADLVPGQTFTFSAHSTNQAAFVEVIRRAPSVGTYALTVNPVTMAL